LIQIFNNNQGGVKATLKKGESVMRRINIRKNGKIITITCKEKRDLFVELQANKFFNGLILDLSNISEFTNKLWNLNVGKSIKCWGYTFSINSKRRVGNQLSNNMTIGKL